MAVMEGYYLVYDSVRAAYAENQANSWRAHFNITVRRPEAAGPILCVLMKPYII